MDLIIEKFHEPEEIAEMPKIGKIEITIQKRVLEYENFKRTV